MNESRSTLFACLALFWLTLRRQLRSRQTLICLALAVVVGLMVYATTWRPSVQPKRLANNVFIPTFVAFLMPIFAVCYGASGFGSEREDRTLVYLLISSLPRPLAYLVKGLACQLLVAAWTVGTLWAYCRIAGVPGTELLPIFLRASLLGSLAYASLFLLVGAAFRHGTIISLVYWFFLEVLLGNLPGIVKRVSIAYYVRCVIYSLGEKLKIGPLNEDMWVGISGPAATTALVSLVVGLTLVGVVSFSRREYADVG